MTHSRKRMPLLAAGNFLAEIVRNTNERGVRQKMTTNTRASLCRFGYLLLLVFLADWSTTAKGWAQASHVSASEVLCEYRKDPIGIDALHPRLSWVLTASQQSEKQTAYEILVASSKEALAENQADIWETGKVISAQSIQILFQGKDRKRVV